MNRKSFFTSIRLGFLSLVMLLSPLSAQTEESAPRNIEQEHRMLMLLLRMDSQELANLRMTIERIEAMSPEERNAMRKRLGKFQRLSAEQRDALKKRVEAVPKKLREEMRNRWFSMSAHERMQWRQKLRQMTPEERVKVIREQGFLPPPPDRKLKGPKKDQQVQPPKNDSQEVLESDETPPES